jgi:hypothetical protein
MIEKTSLREGKYLYAVVSGSKELNYGVCGINEGTVYTIPTGQMAAVVSDVANGKIRPERRHLAAHQGVLRRLMEETVPLPVAFGIVADSRKAIQAILSANQQAFLDQFNRVDGKVEMGLRVTWDVPNIFEYYVQTHAELKVARDRFFGSHGAPSQEDKIELGRMFGQALNEDRETHAEKVEEVLSGHCFEIKRNKCRTEREVMTLACLVEREALPEFEEGIFEAAKLFDDNFAFDYNGPWPPHNFVDIDLKL